MLLHQVIGLRSCKAESGAANVTLVFFTLFTGVDLPEVSSTVVDVRKDLGAGQTFALSGRESNYSKIIRALLLQRRQRSFELVVVCNERRASVLSHLLTKV